MIVCGLHCMHVLPASNLSLPGHAQAVAVLTACNTTLLPSIEHFSHFHIAMRSMLACFV